MIAGGEAPLFFGFNAGPQHLADGESKRRNLLPTDRLSIIRLPLDGLDVCRRPSVTYQSCSEPALF